MPGIRANSGPGALVVTGASRGIGAATALLAASRGWAVCVNYRESAAGAESVVREIRENGGCAVAVRADVSSEEDIIRLFDSAQAQLGPIAGLVNNAAVTGGAASVESVTRATLEEVLTTNVAGPILCSREAVRRMSVRRGGRGGAIVLVSSIAARTGAPGVGVHYAASKGAIDSFTRGLAEEIAPDHIRVNAVRPGVIDTEMHASVNMPDRAREAAPNIPLKRAGAPQEVAAAILWLLSDEASYITGTLLDVSGGR